MNTDHIHHRLSPQEYAALMDAAKLHAMALRREAIRGFWRAVDRGVRSAWRSVRRGMGSSRRISRPKGHAVCP
jgi:hypothetical protein